MTVLATWNVNSLRVRLPQVMEFIQRHQPVALALQETKLTDDLFPLEALNALGYHALYRGQTAYNGVAWLSQQPMTLMQDFLSPTDANKRFLWVKMGAWHLINVYVPNGAAVDSDKYVYKLQWLTELQNLLKKLQALNEPYLVMGDFNIAPTDEDVWDPEELKGQILVSDAERSAWQDLLAIGLADVYHCFGQKPGYTWWDYRARSWARKRGMRIDHMLMPQDRLSLVKRSWVDAQTRADARPSDHAPLLVELLQLDPLSQI